MEESTAEVHYFRARLAKRVVWLKNGNEIIYSLNESLAQSVYWKLIIWPSDNEFIWGRIQKINKGKSLWKDAKQAIYGSFTNLQSVYPRKFNSSVDDFQPQKLLNVAFTLRADDLEILEECANRNPEDAIPDDKLPVGTKIGTGIVKFEKSLVCVYGWMQFQEPPILEECVKYLNKQFTVGGNILIWMNYCTDLPRWEGFCGRQRDDSYEEI
ncbi:unnamed protein product [Clavelina lepadiformis]|uniref:Uncharacterized protein n=1 Tax=Clavelina lepadiformis TaxID=159417 RepID=A0ABP0GCS3_CLALP